ncbi:MAG: hypothetical protein Q4B31_01340 [Clostridia bacterium]|nr:hypothetical protein [Clostridia bacterium]
MIKDFIVNNFEESKKSGDRVRQHLLSSPVAFHGRCVQTLHIPKIFSQKDVEIFKDLTGKFYKIFEKVIDNYVKNSEYRKLFPFSKELEGLILKDTLLESRVPIMRMDIFYNEETGGYKFCEINTDGSSAMVEDLELSKAFSINNIPRELLGDIHSFELFDTWVTTVGRIYKEYPKKKDNPTVAIVDFLDKAYLPEFYEFKKRFQKYGYSTIIADIREVKYKDGVLYSKDNERIDIVYRRAVTVDIMNNLSECKDFLDAYMDNAMLTLGSIKTQIIHHKALFYILRDKMTKEFLEKEEIDLIEKHIPYTAKLKDSDIQEVKCNKDKYIVKPSDSYASKGVFAGVDYSKKEWAEIIDKSLEGDYIVQEYQVPYKTENIYMPEDNPEFKMYSNLTGLYVYDGVFSGIYSRLSDGGIISSQYNEKSVATFIKIN